MRRITLASALNGEWCQCYEMTLDLDRQYLQDSEVAEEVGELKVPFHMSREEIG